MPGSAGARDAGRGAGLLCRTARPTGAGVMVKAIGGGGGRGMRAVLDAAELAEALRALHLRGAGGLRCRRRLCRAADAQCAPHRGAGARRRPGGGEPGRARMHAAAALPEAGRDRAEPVAVAERCAQQVTQRGAAHGPQRSATRAWAPSSSWSTSDRPTLPFVFIEANPRLQVEHTVTEAVTGLDLVQLQIAVAAGETLAALGHRRRPHRRRSAASRCSGASTPRRSMPRAMRGRSGGTLARFDLPAGPGVRVDTHGYAGLAPSPHYDTLLAKLDRACAVAALRRRAAALAARAGRMPHRGHRHQPVAAARHRAAARVRDAGGAHALRRGAPGRPARRRGAHRCRRHAGGAQHAPRAAMPTPRRMRTTPGLVKAPMPGEAGAVRSRGRRPRARRRAAAACSRP